MIIIVKRKKLVTQIMEIVMVIVGILAIVVVLIVIGPSSHGESLGSPPCS